MTPRAAFGERCKQGVGHPTGEEGGRTTHRLNAPGVTCYCPDPGLNCCPDVRSAGAIVARVVDLLLVFEPGRVPADHGPQFEALARKSALTRSTCVTTLRRACSEISRVVEQGSEGVTRLDIRRRHVPGSRCWGLLLVHAPARSANVAMPMIARPAWRDHSWIRAASAGTTWLDTHGRPLTRMLACRWRSVVVLAVVRCRLGGRGRGEADDRVVATEQAAPDGPTRVGVRRLKGIEPSSSVWKTEALPLSYSRSG